MSILEFRPKVPEQAALGHEMQYRVVHGYQRAYVHVGRGPALLLLHGIGDSSETWREIIPILARTHTVIAPDLLGHGRSDKPRADYSVAAYANGMRDLLSVLGVDRATVIGHSPSEAAFQQRTSRLSPTAIICCGAAQRSSANGQRCRNWQPVSSATFVIRPGIDGSRLSRPVATRRGSEASSPLV